MLRSVRGIVTERERERETERMRESVRERRETASNCCLQARTKCRRWSSISGPASERQALQVWRILSLALSRLAFCLSSSCSLLPLGFSLRSLIESPVPPFRLLCNAHSQSHTHTDPHTHTHTHSQTDTHTARERERERESTVLTSRPQVTTSRKRRSR